MGIKALQEYVQQHQSPPSNKDTISMVSKARIKVAKALLPYEYVEPCCETSNNVSHEGSSTKHDRHDFIVQKIQERQSLRNARRFAEADYLRRGLQAMGVDIDDIHKTWTVNRKQEINQQSAGTSFQSATVVTSKQLSSTPKSLGRSVACQMCGHYFASRNLVFQHLRDPASGCGTQIFAQSLEIPLAPSIQKKKEATRKGCGTEATLRTTAPLAPGQTAVHTPAAHGIWLGDIPLPWTRRQQWIRAILASHLSSLDIPTPWVRKIVRKGYRQTSRCNGETLSNDEVQKKSPNQKGAYLGYAIVFFRDPVEATAARITLDGKHVSVDNTFWGNLPTHLDVSLMPDFCLKAQPVEKGESLTATIAWESNSNDTEGPKGHDPPLVEQLRPLALPEIRERLKRFDKGNNNTTMNTDTATPSNSTAYASQHQELLDQLVVIMPPRQEQHVEGRLLPEILTQELLTLLQTMKWPARNERPGLTAQRYFVLPTHADRTDRFYQNLRQACRRLMDWADPDYYYSGIAVTHNFVASPHIDVKDQNYQYAVALGDFIGGGQLCVEAEHGDSVKIINTKNRIAKLDGRQVHWVRTWTTGSRYSLIFYDTRIPQY
jgi:hypothetical protein